ncbi:MAG: hypothetical protein ACRC33_16730 [Gemmataceae bacterium]
MEYTVVLSGVLRARLKELFEDGAAAGQYEQMLVAVRSFDARLRADPHEVGEITHQLPHGRQPVHHAVDRPVSFCFAIDDARRVVWVTKIERLLARHE